MSKIKKSVEDKQVDSKKSVEKPAPKKAAEKPAPKKAAEKPAPKKAAESVKKADPVVIKLGQRVRHIKKSHVEGEVISVRSSEEGFTIKMTLLCSDGRRCALSVEEAVII